MWPKILIVATSRKTRGGITSVIKAHEIGEQWKVCQCRWIETHVDAGFFAKLFILFKGLIQYLWFLPQAKMVHIHLSEPISAKRKSVFFKLAKLFGKKTIVHFHAFSPKTTIYGPNSGLYRCLFSNADAVVVLSDYWKKIITEKYGIKKNVKVIFNPCPAVLMPEKYEKTKSILYAGTLNARKGYADLIKAFGKIADKYPEWRLTLAGNGEIEEGHQLARNLKIEDKCDFLGWVNGTAKDQIFKQASIFCLPSYAEGFPMAILDAWAYGLPVITTPVGGIPDIADDGNNLLLFEPGNIEQLAICLEKAVADESLRNSLSEESLKLAATTFNISTINRQIGELYKEVLEGAPV